ncbi:hypothetical protein [uncultured Desulfovibrio sp.]|uniref:hypothetical protein n=1 Tax=uncultured Desulfovibrio sp. TaxID=167968 RepID=UPI0020508221|nr:hypothetical protein [uncultured Desulfovibrio sp.]DAV75476.1 MAG TPA: hypothetical protein [Caudoviricetes sp.]
MNIDSIVKQYAANKAEDDRLTALNAELAEQMLKAAVFKGDSDTGHLTAGGYKVAITRRINEKWDQDQLQALRKRMGESFLGIFKQKFEPDRKALRGFFAACADESLKKQLRAACTATPGKPGVKLEVAS